jgi:hypothetical protein
MSGRLCFAISVKFIVPGRPAEAAVGSVFYLHLEEMYCHA